MLDYADISTERLILRKPVEGDLQTLFDIHGDPATNVYNPAGPHTSVKESKTMLKTWLDIWQRHGFGYWSVVLKSEPQTLLGFGGVSLKDNGGEPYLNLYFRFSPKVWGRGYASETARAALEHGCELGYSEIIASVRPDNAPSIRVLERLGLTYFSTIKDKHGDSYL